MCAAAVCYMRLLLEELGYEQKQPTKLYVDNKAARFVASDPVQSAALKHVKRRHFFIREMTEIGEVVVIWIASKCNLADALTKCLPVGHFQYLTSRFMGKRLETGETQVEGCPP